jgi:peptidyl-prolyl cis-trans isomerase A (cyclophilin A)
MANPTVVLETTAGSIKIELFADKAPLSVANFLQYVDDKHYDGTIFHRVIADFMVQGGGFTADMKQKPTRAPIKNEAKNGLQNEPYTLAMARTSDVDSATSQFFINVADNVFLNHGGRDFGYCVFGQVIGGTEVVDTIAECSTSTKAGMKDVPVETITIKSARRG